VEKLKNWYRGLSRKEKTFFIGMCLFVPVLSTTLCILLGVPFVNLRHLARTVIIFICGIGVFSVIQDCKEGES
jgi:hypothetical protein